MGTFFVYILKTTLCLAGFYLFYRLLLSRETFHRFNRIVLLSILLLSLLIPLIEVSTAANGEVHQAVLSIEMLLMMAGDSSTVVTPETEKFSVTWMQMALLVYLIGVFFFIGRHLYSLWQMVRLFRSGHREKLPDGMIRIVHQKNIAPFSWINFIVISQKDFEENGREILIHEKAHIRYRHSIDLLIADICIFFQWFNPASWLLKQELQNIHEYEADETVIREGVNPKEYQLLLIKKAVGTRLYSMANSFNHSKLKKRITMMLKEKSNPWARLKYLYVLPLAAIAVTAFARPEISDTVNEISAIKVNDLAAIVETKVEESPQDSSEKGSAGIENSSPIASSVVLSSDPKSGKRESQRVETMTDTVRISETKVTKLYPANSKKSPILFSTTGKELQPLLIVDGEEVPNFMLKEINPNRIESISVLKDHSAVKLYGKKGENGVVIVTLKDGEPRQIKATTITTDSLKGKMLFLEKSTIVRDKEGNPTSISTEGATLK
ncbi:M56 family metallopeptidase [Bacteroides sp.]|uniref:M56 family metallopeptidase n=1 Tax=Bacteroides sp. TaxID=29523 RepID=UPI002FC951BE